MLLIQKIRGLFQSKPNTQQHEYQAQIIAARVDEYRTFDPTFRNELMDGVVLSLDKAVMKGEPVGMEWVSPDNKLMVTTLAYPTRRTKAELFHVWIGAPACLGR